MKGGRQGRFRRHSPGGLVLSQVSDALPLVVLVVFLTSHTPTLHLSLTVLIYVSKHVYDNSPSCSSPDTRIPSNHPCDRCVTLSHSPPRFPPPAHSSVRCFLFLWFSSWLWGTIIVFLHFLLVVLSNKNSLSLPCWRVANGNPPNPWLSPWPRKLLPETSVSGQQSRHEDGRGDH
jgi:hypothetical protein